MADEKNGKEGKAGQSPWAGLLASAGQRLMPVLLTAGSLIGFIAFAGGVIVWTRFSAAKVPPDQAVNAVPRDELVAIGSAVLLLFGFFGVLALIGAFLIDRRARATPGMARGLLAGFLIEAVVVVLVFEGLSAVETIAVAELIALPVFAALWATFSERYVGVEDDLPLRAGVERPGRRRYGMFLLPAEIPASRPRPPGSTRVEGRRFPRLASALSCLADLPSRLPGRARLGLRGMAALGRALGPILFAVVGIVGAVPIIAFDLSDLWLLCWLSFGIAALVLSAVISSRDEARSVRERIEVERALAAQEDMRRDAERAAEAKSRMTAKEYERHERQIDEGEAEESGRLLNERPMRLVLKGWGVALAAATLIAAVGLPWWRLEAGWVAVSIAAAAALAAALWRIASLSAERVIWYGVAVFLSIPLFGTLMTMARNVDDPQVQPMALIRTSDGPDESIQGLYVTEADDRVYFASVATEGCTDELTAHSGRLGWVPKSEVVAMSVGPLQDVDDAADSALEMAYALTPAVETPAGTEASFTPAERGVAEDQEASSQPAKRLEDTGPAVRPFYGSGLSLVPEDASPGEKVTLQMSAPNESERVRGFGRTREGHTVRVGGVRATILKEYAHRADTAEYVETREGVLLRLEKDEPYEESGDRFVRVEEFDPESKERLFLKLVDSRVISVGGKTMGEDDDEEGGAGIYLEIASDRRGEPVLVDPELPVVLKTRVREADTSGAAFETTLEPRPKAQAWHERQIRFVVPENASTGAVAVECSQLAGQPLLRVAHAPEARISVRMQAGSTRVSFDSSRSEDADGEPISRRWDIAGLRRGNLPEISVDLPPRPRAYTVRMTATDESGRIDVAEVRLLRLPASLFELDEDDFGNEPVLVEARKTLEDAARERPPAAVEIYGHADDSGTGRHNVRLSLRRAKNVREFLLRAPEEDGEPPVVRPVRTLAYGEGCPVDPRSGRNRRNRRVEVFVLDHGVSMIPPAGCHPRRLQSTEWKLPPREGGQ